MRFSALFSAVSIAVAGVASSPLDSRDLDGLLGGADLSAANRYGAPNPPWTLNSKPGWYYGSHPGLYVDIPCLSGVRLDRFTSSMTGLLTGDFFEARLHCIEPVAPLASMPSGFVVSAVSAASSLYADLL